MLTLLLVNDSNFLATKCRNFMKKKTFQFFSEIWKKSELMTPKDFFLLLALILFHSTIELSLHKKIPFTQSVQPYEKRSISST